MTAYVIAYSIVMIFLLAATVALCYFTVRISLRRAARDGERNAGGDGNIFSEIYGNGKSVTFLLVDSETGMPVYVSPNASMFFGVGANEILRDIESIKKNIDHTYVREFMQRFNAWKKDAAIAEGARFFGQEFGYGDGKVAKLEAFIAERDGKKYDALIIYDVTEQKLAIDKMRGELDVALGQASAKTSFLSSMSHEIRTPMNGVMGMMSLAKMNINDPIKARGYLERAGDLSLFLLGMINDILDISKIDSGKMQLFNTNVDMFGFAEKIRNMFTGTITGKGIAFKVETIDFSVRHLICDEMRLTQVVTNLVSNASKFTPSGGSIDVTLKQLDKLGDNVQIMIRVRDTGKGIAPENINKIMRPFEQESASTAHNYGGTGLGLAICDNIVRLMGGNIVIDSELGKGSDFSIFLSLPIADVDQNLEKPIAVDAPPVHTDFTFDGVRILLAEDNEVNAEIATEILESEGAIVTLARDGREAVEIFESGKEKAFDLLLLDIQMPRLSGRDAAKEIRASKRKYGAIVPIIALSADAFVEDVKLSEASGMDGHVSKPIDFDVLRLRAGEIISAKKQAKA